MVTKKSCGDCKKECWGVKCRKCYTKNKLTDEGKKERVRKYYKDNIEKIKAKRKKTKANNKKMKAYKKKWDAKNYKNRKKAVCIICGKSAYRKYCSQGCKSIGMIGEKNIKWKGGKSFIPYPSTFNIQFKRTIRIRDNNCCLKCGKPRKLLKKALYIHHIDAIKKNTFKENCISLCYKCHSLTIGKEKKFSKGFYKKLSRLYGYVYK